MDPIKELVNRIVTLEKGFKARSTPQLAFTSLENGSIKQFDEFGNLVAEYGLAWDGTSGENVYTGPQPPVCTDPILEGVIGGLKVSWDGLFLNSLGEPDQMVLVPGDFKYVEVHVSQTDGFTPSADTLKNTILTVQGAEVTISLPPGVYYVKFVTRTKPGLGAPTLVSVRGEVTPITDSDVVLTEIDASTTKIINAGRVEVETGKSLESALNDAATSLITDERLPDGTLTKWPFADNTVPAGTIGSNEIADFSLLVTKFKTNRHHIY